MKTDFVIITSAYNEEHNIIKSLKSVVRQTILPKEWIIINDGSTDSTETIISRFTKDYAWIKLVTKVKEEVDFGAHAVVNFYLGIEHLTIKNYDFIIQLDADISIDRSDYFEYQLNHFNSDPKLGISSGITYSVDEGIKTLTKRKYWRTGGATKMYRIQCLSDIEGLKPIFSWDGLDVYQAMYRGWKSRTFFELHVNHLGKSRMKDRNRQLSQIRIKGRTMYQRGYPLEFIILKFIKYFIHNHHNAMGFLKGYTSAKRSNIPRLVSADEKKFIRKVQYLRIIDLFVKKQLL
jgi:glycosyltransferase involved in cell wall biosynthesis